MAGACGDAEACPSGSEGCPCQAGGCDPGLVCASNYCVDPNWEAPPVTPGEAAPGTSGQVTAGNGAGPGDGQADGGDGSSPDNVAACEALVDEIECGEFDLSSVVDCSLYAGLACDIADYFDCVRDNISCVDGVPDSSGIINCADLANC